MAATDRTAVIVINWNGWQTSLECLAALRRSVGAEWHCFLVDNGSTDDSLRHLQGLGDDVTLLRAGANLGWTGGNNLAIRAALKLGYQRLFILNNDAFVVPDTIAQLVAASSGQTPPPVLGAVHRGVGSNAYDFTFAATDPKTGIPYWSDAAEGTPVPDLNNLIETAYVGGAALFAHAEHFRVVGLLDDRFFLNFDDTDWCARAAKAGYPLHMVTSAVIHHEGSASIGGRYAPLQTYFLARNRLLYARKHSTLLQRLRLLRRYAWTARELVPGPRLQGLWRLLRAQDGTVAAFRQGVIDYVRGRFGDCPDSVRTWQARFSSRAPAAPLAPVLAVSAIVPTFNRAHFLAETLESIFAQTTPPHEVIVVDDGSTDGTAIVAARFGDRIRYLRQDNGGKSSALNLALGHATGEAIWIVDDDDIAEPDALTHLVTTLKATPQAGFAFGDYDNFRVGPDGDREFTSVDKPVFEARDLFSALLDRCFIFQPALLVRRQCYDAVGPFDRELVRAQDYEMLLRLARRYEGVHVPRVLFHQRAHEGVRGTAEHPIDGASVWVRQNSFDAKVVRKLHAECSLAEYLPRGVSGVEPPDPEFRARLRRSAALARRMIWDLAIDDIRAAHMIAEAKGTSDLPAAEAALLARVFDEFGVAHCALDPENPLLRAVVKLPPGAMREALLSALTWPLFRYAIRSARRAELDRFGQHLNTYRRFAGGRALPRHLYRALRSRTAAGAWPTGTIADAA